MLSLFNTDCHIASQMVCFRCYSFGFMIIAQTAAFRNISHPSRNPKNKISPSYSFQLLFLFSMFLFIVLKNLSFIVKMYVLFWKFEMVMYHHLCFMCVSFLSYLLSLPIYLPPIQCLYTSVCALICAILSVFSITPSFTLKTINPTTKPNNNNFPRKIQQNFSSGS